MVAGGYDLHNLILEFPLVQPHPELLPGALMAGAQFDGLLIIQAGGCRPRGLIQGK